MIRSKFRNKFLKNSSVNNKKACNKESNFSSGLLGKTKKEYLKLDVNNMVDDRRLFKTVKKIFEISNLILKVQVLFKKCDGFKRSEDS